MFWTSCIVLSLLAYSVLAQVISSDKRLLLHSDDDVIVALQNMSLEINKLKQTIATLTQELSDTNQKLAVSGNNAGQGSTYIRWGRTTCPGNGTELVYKGFAAGNHYSYRGGAADYLCLSMDVQWGEYDDSHQSQSAKLYGVEYEFGEQFSDGGAKFFGQDLYDHDVPCALCRSNKPSSVMIPGRTQCYPGWSLEYSGYLVSGRVESDHDPAATNYACLDNRPETILGDASNDNGKLMVLVEGVCGSLKCPPYVANREIACVVCTK